MMKLDSDISRSLIFFNYSDEPNDIYERKSTRYNKNYKDALELARLNLDVDDDGILDIEETGSEFITRRVTR